MPTAFYWTIVFSLVGSGKMLNIQDIGLLKKITKTALTVGTSERSPHNVTHIGCLERDKNVQKTVCKLVVAKEI